jgi:hypothetical protein
MTSRALSFRFPVAGLVLVSWVALSWPPPVAAHGGEKHQRPPVEEPVRSRTDAAPDPDAAVDPDALPDPAAHDHAEPEASVLSWVGRFHPSTIHFPIAFLVGALVAEALLAWTRRELFDHAARFLVWSGAASAIVAAPLG